MTHFMSVLCDEQRDCVVKDGAFACRSAHADAKLRFGWHIRKSPVPGPMGCQVSLESVWTIGGLN